MNIKDYLKNKFIILDGAMGTMLQKQGLKPKDVPEAFNIERPEIIAKYTKNTLRLEQILLQQIPLVQMNSSFLLVLIL